MIMPFISVGAMGKEMSISILFDEDGYIMLPDL